MRNIWGWVVGVLVVVGAGITIGKFFTEDSSRSARAPRPAPTAPATAPAAKAGAAMAQAGATDLPKPIASYSDMKITPEDFSLGKVDAPVVMVEYASLTCPHCAAFHNNVLPAIKTEFIDTGKVRMIYRDFPLDRVALSASMLAHCAGRDRYFGFIGAFFAAQANWARDNNPVAALGRIARVGGMSEQDVNACLSRQEVADAVLKKRLEGEKTFGVNSTPTIIIGGDKFGGGLSIEQFRAIVASKLKKS